MRSRSGLHRTYSTLLYARSVTVLHFLSSFASKREREDRMIICSPYMVLGDCHDISIISTPRYQWQELIWCKFAGAKSVVQVLKKIDGKSE